MFSFQNWQSLGSWRRFTHQLWAVHLWKLNHPWNINKKSRWAELRPMEYLFPHFDIWGDETGLPPHIAKHLGGGGAQVAFIIFIHVFLPQFASSWPIWSPLIRACTPSHNVTASPRILQVNRKYQPWNNVAEQIMLFNYICIHVFGQWV